MSLSSKDSGKVYQKNTPKTWDPYTGSCQRTLGAEAGQVFLNQGEVLLRDQSLSGAFSLVAMRV